MVVSMAIIPVMIRLAPRVGMVDLPDPRKVHTTPIPRVGGVGIVIGSLLPVLLWLPLDHQVASFVFGAAVLLVFGIWDDCRELGHYTKFIGQFVAVIAVVYVGDVYVTQLPFMDLEPLPDSLAKPFTVFAMVGMINAINHSDGLDGLAGGLSILSLVCIAYLASLTDATVLIMICAATVGGVFGFLRFNTHPARVFMGDGGSQFLGFALGYAAVLLTQNVHPTLSPALPALLLGLPIIDILAVFAQRVYHRMNWFRASKNHIHHRLLSLGFDHYEAVVLIYSVQLLFVVSATFLKYDSDGLVLGLYAGVCALVFVLLWAAEKGRWRAHRHQTESPLTRTIRALRGHWLVTTGPYQAVLLAVPALFLLVSVLARDMGREIGIGYGAAALAVVLLVYLFAAKQPHSIVPRAISYITAAFVVFVETNYLPLPAWATTVEIGFFSVLAVAIALSVRFSRALEFRTTPMDYLVLFVVIALGIVAHNQAFDPAVSSMVIKLVIVFYGCEVIFARLTSRWNILNLSSLATLAIFGVKGLG